MTVADASYHISAVNNLNWLDNSIDIGEETLRSDENHFIISNSEQDHFSRRSSVMGYVGVQWLASCPSIFRIESIVERIRYWVKRYVGIELNDRRHRARWCDDF